MQASPVKFSSNIYLVDQPTFTRLQEKLTPDMDEDELHGDREFSADPFSINTRVINQPRGVVQGAADCTIGGITNGKGVTLTHLYPSELTGYALPRWLAHDLRLLQGEATRELRGLITAGHACGNRRSVQSRQVYEGLLETMQGFGDAVTKLWGRKLGKGAVSALYNAATDSWYLYVARPDKVESSIASLWDFTLLPGFAKQVAKDWTTAFDPTVTRTPNPAMNLADLKDTFEIVQIAEGDKIIGPNDKGYQKHLKKALQST